MEQYISKDKIIEEIKRRRKSWCGNSVEAKYKREECDDILFVIDNIETKEVDFIKEFYAFSEKHKLMDKGVEFADIEKTASFFFQLGLKAAQNERKSCTTNE